MSQQLNLPLPHGFKLQRYTIDRVISTGGFSIVYLGYANADQTPVAIKEFMPSGIPVRTKKKNSIHFQDYNDERRFDIGLRAFSKESEAISRINHPSVVGILDFFMENQTGYLVMPFEHGRTLQRIISKESHLLNDVMIQRIFCDILNGMSVLHQNHILHLDLKPSNIWIKTNGVSMIIDFGTSLVGEDVKSVMPPMHTPGFAAPEQHRKLYKAEYLGPWTDIYNFGATIYSCIEGKPPTHAEERVLNQDIICLERRWQGQFHSKMLDMVDQMLSLEIQDRPQQVQMILDVIAHYPPLQTRDHYKDFALKTFYNH